MIHSIKFKNFFSFLDEANISFEVGKHAPQSSLFTLDMDKNAISKLIAVFGSNGSGKTNALKPLVFLKWFISSSFSSLKPDDEIPIEHHFFSASDACEIEITFELEKRIYKYALVVARSLVLKEALYVKTSKFFSYLFKREWDEKNGSYIVNQKKFGLPVKATAKIRKNASLISIAMQYEVECAKVVSNFFSNIHTNVNIDGRDSFHAFNIFSSANFFYENEKLKEKMVKIICQLDLGLSDLVIEKREVEVGENKREEIEFAYGIHKLNDKTVQLPFMRESSGTQRVFVLLEKILKVLEHGGVAVFDEMESDLHPDMMIALLELFVNPSSNPFNAQIIFASHGHEVLNFLDKTQIVLVEKDENGNSDLWRLDEMQGIRRDDNLYAKYRAGAYGAIPNI